MSQELLLINNYITEEQAKIIQQELESLGSADQISPPKHDRF